MKINNKMENTEKVEETNKTDLTTESKINENVVESKNEANKENNKKFIPITKNSSLNAELFSLSYISEYKCKFCGLIPNEIICCGVLYCNECLPKLISTKEEAIECPICKKNDMKHRKIKYENKIFYKVL